jgi:translation initiation factor eIF-2B subunit beta
MIEDVCELAPNHIDERETVMTFGSSFSMTEFFLQAAKAKPFHIIALEAEPHGHTARMAEKLAADGLLVTVDIIPDSSCFALVSRVSKVFISTDAVLANGGLLAPTGTKMLALAAKHFSVPIVVVTTTLKICPYFPSDSIGSSLVKLSKTTSLEAQWSTFSQPSAVLAPEDVHEVDVDDNVAEVFNPVLEYVPPEFVALVVTNEGELTTTVIHRYLKDQYHADDTHI